MSAHTSFQRFTPTHVGSFIRYRLVLPTLYRGRRYECPCCGRTFRRFRPYHLRREVLCPACGSLERHRLIWLYVQKETDLGSNARRSLLHVAPESALRRLFETMAGVRYVAGDLDPARGTVQFDLRELPYPDGAFDYVICSHVFDYIPEDTVAMRELARVLADGGRAIVLVSLDSRREQTREGAPVNAYVDPPVRSYGTDVIARLEAAGLAVEPLLAGDFLSPADVERHRLDPEEVLFVCRRFGGGVESGEAREGGGTLSAI